MPSPRRKRSSLTEQLTLDTLRISMLRRQSLGSPLLPNAWWLCSACQKIVLNSRQLKDIPQSPSNNDTPALDWNLGWIDLGYEFKDEYPGLAKLKRSASRAKCKFCQLLANAIIEDSTSQRELWNKTFRCGSPLYISIRYHCGSELGRQSFEPGEWFATLSSLEVRIMKGRFDTEPVIKLTFIASCDDGTSSHNAQKEEANEL
jgi:hypothetical protein